MPNWHLTKDMGITWAWLWTVFGIRPAGQFQDKTTGEFPGAPKCHGSVLSDTTNKNNLHFEISKRDRGPEPFLVLYSDYLCANLESCILIATSKINMETGGCLPKNLLLCWHNVFLKPGTPFSISSKGWTPVRQDDDRQASVCSDLATIFSMVKFRPENKVQVTTI